MRLFWSTFCLLWPRHIPHDIGRFETGLSPSLKSWKALSRGHRGHKDGWWWRDKLMPPATTRCAQSLFLQLLLHSWFGNWIGSFLSPNGWKSRAWRILVFIPKLSSFWAARDEVSRDATVRNNVIIVAWLLPFLHTTIFYFSTQKFQVWKWPLEKVGVSFFARNSSKNTFFTSLCRCVWRWCAQMCNFPIYIKCWFASRSYHGGKLPNLVTLFWYHGWSSTHRVSP